MRAAGAAEEKSFRRAHETVLAVECAVREERFEARLERMGCRRLHTHTRTSTLSIPTPSEPSGPIDAMQHQRTQ